jgi:hypothetical protein
MAAPASPLSAVSKRLRAVLEDALGTDPPVDLAPPTRKDRGDQDRSFVSVWLYQVTADEFARNRTPPQVETANGRKVRLRLPPLAVNLSYLVTPVLDNQEDAQNVLAAVMLALHEAAQLAVEDPASEAAELITVSLVPDTLDDRVKLWESLGQPYRLSACYQVRTVRLVSKLADAAAPVGSLTARSEEPPAVRVVD